MWTDARYEQYIMIFNLNPLTFKSKEQWYWRLLGLKYDVENYFPPLARIAEWLN